MLEKDKIQDLVTQSQYVKVFNYFHAEYTQTLKDFLIRHDVGISENDSGIG